MVFRAEGLRDGPEGFLEAGAEAELGGVGAVGGEALRKVGEGVGAVAVVAAGAAVGGVDGGAGGGIVSLGQRWRVEDGEEGG